jgi:D-3-phosphoglycerate dehydrogenase
VNIFASGPSGPNDELQPLVDAGHALRVGRPQTMPGRTAYTEAELAHACVDAQVLMASHLEPVTQAVMEEAHGLKMVIVPFIGVDRVDLAAATKLGIAVANSPTAENFISVAEAAIGLMLMLLKRIKHNEARLRGGLWGGLNDRGDLLYKKNVGIVGLGRSGIEVARRLEPWGVQLLAADPYAEAARAAQLNVKLVDLPTLLRESHVVSLHATVTPQTQYLINAQTLGLMKPDAILINTARGALVDEAALADALAGNRLGAAALDSFEHEPLPGSSVLRLVDPARLVLTPHNVCQTQAGRCAGIALAIEQILAVGKGSLPKHLLNLEVAAHWRGLVSIH